MAKFNLSIRIELFAICTSIEIDIKKFILQNNGNIAFSAEMLEKAQERKKEINSDNQEEVLDQLDLKDYIMLICNSPYLYGINNEKSKKLEKYFEKIIPVRNRVMHTKPLELGDRALLIEVMEKINDDLSWISWSEIQETKRKLETNPSELLSQNYTVRTAYNPKVYNNLPEPEFDDTGYIGRVREQKEIKDLILNKKNQIITIVGNGGVGKTAIVVKTLYDLVDDPQCPYECIIWLTLKTKTLSHGEFVQIENCIKSIPDLYKFSKEIIITDSEKPSKEMLLRFMDDFKVLLVLDNLETINSDEINQFMKEIPEKSKVLITSRHGLGELEIRKKLDGLEKHDTIVYFRELSKYYGLNLHKRNDADIYKITGEALYSNPLSIKWFISGIFNGMDEKKLLAQKDNLVNFCISNVFEKLSDDAKKILQIFLLEKKRLSYGAIDFYMNIDEVDLREAINELLSTYMINSISGEYVMNDMSREYISLNYPPDNNFITHIFNKRKELKHNMQAVQVYSEQAPFNPKSICAKLTDDDKQLATYYLQEALKRSKAKKWEEANFYCDKAQSIAPNFFEIYKIKAFIDAERGEYYGAINNYETALLKCENNKEKAIVCYLFSVFYTIKMQELDYGLDYIEEADKLCPDTSEILLEKTRAYMYRGRFDEAEIFLNQVKQMEKNPVLRTQNIWASRYAELYRRKAEILEQRDYEKKLELYKMAINQLNSVRNLDIKSGVTLLLVLSDLAYLYYSKEAMTLLVDTINKNYLLLSKISHHKKSKMCEFLRAHKEDILPEIYVNMERFITDYRFFSSEITNNNEGIVIALKEYFGFITNHEYKNSNAIFFLKANAYEGIQVGDYVSFEIYDGKKGKAAKNIILSSQSDKLLD